jgi:zinc protease
VDVYAMRIDDVAVFWTPHEGDLEATLVFRVGTADEPLPFRGITELVHRTARATATGSLRGLGGTVDLLTTSLRCTGGTGAVVDFLAQAGTLIHGREDSRVEAHDALVLEDRAWEPELEQRLLRLRHGFVGPGTGAAPRLGLYGMAAHHARSWAHRFCAAGNAALVLRGAPPADLRIALPPGPRRPATEPATRARSWPAAVHASGTNVALALTGTTSLAFRVVVQLLVRSFRERVVERQRLATEVVAGYTRSGPRTTQAVLLVTTAHGTAQQVHEELVAELDLVNLHRFPAMVAGALVQALRAEATDPFTLPAIAEQAAVDWLLGAPPRRPAELAAELGRLTLDDLSQALWDATGTAAWLLPPHVVPDRRTVVADDRTPTALPGTVYEQAHRAEGEPRSVLVLGPHGISLGTDGEGMQVIRWSDCVAATVGAGGSWRFFGTDGTTLSVWVNRFRGPVPLQQAIASWLPADRLVQVAEPAAGHRSR